MERVVCCGGVLTITAIANRVYRELFELDVGYEEAGASSLFELAVLSIAPHMQGHHKASKMLGARNRYREVEWNQTLTAEMNISQVPRRQIKVDRSIDI